MTAGFILGGATQHLFCRLLLMARVALLLVLSPFGAWAQSVDSTLHGYLGSAGIVAIADTTDNVQDLRAFRVFSSDGPCQDPPRRPGDPYALREDLDGDGTLDAAVLGLHGDGIVLAVCLGKAAGSVCGQAFIGQNLPFETAPRCQVQDVRFEGYQGVRLRPVAPEEGGEREWRVHPVVGVEEGWSTTLFCLDEATAARAEELRACVNYN